MQHVPTQLSAHSHITHILMSGAHDTYRYTARARERPPREKYQPMDQRKRTLSFEDVIKPRAVVLWPAGAQYVHVHARVDTR